MTGVQTCALPIFAGPGADLRLLRPCGEIGVGLRLGHRHRLFAQDVDPASQEIRVDGEAIRKPQRLYFAVNKPVGVVTTNFDPGGRSRVIDLVPSEERLFPVGRLDRFSDGLILVTNDGAFANRLTHPRYGVSKTYKATVDGYISPAVIEELQRGVYLADPKSGKGIRTGLLAEREGLAGAVEEGSVDALDL